MLVEISPVETFVNAIASQRFDDLENAMAPNVSFRALMPPGLRECSRASDVRDVVQGWFGDCEKLELLWSRFESVGDRRTASYRIALFEDGTSFLCEQHLFANVGPDGIERLDLMCSGFRPR